MTDTPNFTGGDALSRRLQAIQNPRMFLGQIALKAVAYAKVAVPRQTGNLGRTIRLGSVTTTSAQILAGGTAGVGYAQFVEFGTRPHVIRPRNKKVLAWGAQRRLSGSARTGSDMIFAHEVNHPGTRAQPFLIPSAQKAVADTGIEVIVKAWNDAA